MEKNSKKNFLISNFMIFKKYSIINDVIFMNISKNSFSFLIKSKKNLKIKKKQFLMQSNYSKTIRNGLKQRDESGDSNNLTIFPSEKFLNSKEIKNLQKNKKKINYFFNFTGIEKNDKREENLIQINSKDSDFEEDKRFQININEEDIKNSNSEFFTKSNPNCKKFNSLEILKKNLSYYEEYIINIKKARNLKFFDKLNLKNKKGNICDNNILNINSKNKIIINFENQKLKIEEKNKFRNYYNLNSDENLTLEKKIQKNHVFNYSIFQKDSSEKYFIQGIYNPKKNQNNQNFSKNPEKIKKNYNSLNNSNKNQKSQEQESISTSPNSSILLKLQNSIKIPNFSKYIKPENKSKPKKTSKPGSFCKCKSKTHCLRLHCSCFKILGFCSESCKCQDCMNTKDEKYRKTRDLVIKNTLLINPYSFTKESVIIVEGEKINKFGCKCKKESCVSKYCNCRKSGAKCSPVCLCVACRNEKVNLSQESVRRFFNRNNRKKHKIVIDFEKNEVGLKKFKKNI